MAQQHAHLLQAAEGVAVADIDVGMVLKVIERDWKRAPATMDRVRRRIGEVLGYAQVRGLRPPGPLPTLWKNRLDKMLPHRATEAGRAPSQR